MTTTLTAPAPAARTRSARRAADPFAGLGTMVGLVVRRNRVRLVVWWISVVGLFAYVMTYYQSIFTTQQSLDDFAAISDVPSIKALTGLAAAPNTMGGAVWTKIWMTCSLMLAFAVLFLVTRNTRADEELGRTELLRSRMLGTQALSMATWLVLAALCIAAGAGIAGVSAFGGLDPEGAGITGSLITGASVMGVGLVGLAVGAVAGQVASTSRGANALGSTVLGLFYLLRMVGDLGDGRLTWVSPIGWAQQMQPWGANRWWPLALILALVASLHLVAMWLESRRDLGFGLLPERSGNAGAPARYATALGLGLRLQRGPIIGWTLTIALSGLMFGSVIEAMTDLIKDAGDIEAQILGGTGVSALLSMLAMMIAMFVTVFAVQSATSLRADEASGMIEPQLAGSLSRTRWALGRLVIPAVGTAVLLAGGGALMGASYGATTGDVAGEAWALGSYAVAYWPAVMVFVGLAVALFAFVPRLATALSWGILAAMWVVVLVGDALHLPDWLMESLPFQATPYQPLEPMSWVPLVVMAVIAAVLLAVGLARFRARDIQPG